jgi:hypothetical protein
MGELIMGGVEIHMPTPNAWVASNGRQCSPEDMLGKGDASSKMSRKSFKAHGEIASVPPSRKKPCILIPQIQIRLLRQEKNWSRMHEKRASIRHYSELLEA